MPKYVEELLISDERGIKLTSTASAWPVSFANLFVGGFFSCAAGVSDLCLDYAADLPEFGLESPKTSSSKCRFLKAIPVFLFFGVLDANVVGEEKRFHKGLFHAASSSKVRWQSSNCPSSAFSATRRSTSSAERLLIDLFDGAGGRLDAVADHDDGRFFGAGLGAGIAELRSHRLLLFCPLLTRAACGRNSRRGSCRGARG